jgi:beta-glucosidase
MMCSYNKLNGVPMCANKPLLTGTLKGEWGFNGSVVSDCSAVSNILLSSPSTSLVQAAASALTAGTDMNCGNAYTVLNESIVHGLAHTTDVDAAISRTLLGRFELGQFEGAESTKTNPYSRINMSVVGSKPHIALARKAALESVVLLKNEGKLLPLTLGNSDTDHRQQGADSSAGVGTKKISKIAVIGPQADDELVLLGNYHGFAFDASSSAGVVTPLQAMKKAASAKGASVSYAKGCPVTGDGAWGWGDAVKAAREADVAVLFLGSSSKVLFVELFVYPLAHPFVHSCEAKL